MFPACCASSTLPSLVFQVSESIALHPPFLVTSEAQLPRVTSADLPRLLTMSMPIFTNASILQTELEVQCCLLILRSLHFATKKEGRSQRCTEADILKPVRVFVKLRALICEGSRLPAKFTLGKF